MKLVLLSAIVLLCLSALPTRAQIYGSRYNPINAGSYGYCGSMSFMDYQNNDPSNGFGNTFGNDSDDVWYIFTVTNTTQINISLCGSNFDTYLHLLDGGGNEIASNDDSGPLCSGLQSSIQITLSPGTYSVVAEGYSDLYGNIVLGISSTGLLPGTTLATAIDAGTLSTPFTDTKNNSSSGCFQNLMGQPSNEIYYKFTLNASAEVSLSHCGTAFDTYMHLLDANGTEIASNDDNGPLCTGLQSSIRKVLNPGTYYVVSEGYGYYSGDITTSLSAVIQNGGIVPGQIVYAPEAVNPDTRTLVTTLPVGSTAGQASVSLTGAATYSIPLFTSPGTSGMQPNVSLVYSSQAGNGIAGYGWNISGLGAINRVPHTIYHDGDVKGVNFVDDRFALDGQRLINLTGSNYGADLTSYYTEGFNGSKIVSHGNLGGAPVWFEVLNKDGSIVEYGRTDDSRFKSQLPNQATVSWNINKITDANGNYIQFVYHRGDIECYLTEIKYTGNDSDPNNTLTPYNSIGFYYHSDRNDKSTVFMAGSRIENNVLLDHIDIRAENSLVKSYKLKYYFDFYSKLNEIEEYGKDNKRYNSTVFGYGSKEESFSNESTDFVLGQFVDIFPGDFNGDGYGDILAATRAYENHILYHTDFTIYLKDPNPNNNSFYPTTTVPLPAHSTVINNQKYPNLDKFIANDVNGDGQSDVTVVQTSVQSYGQKLEHINNYIFSENASVYTINSIQPFQNFQRIKSKNNVFTGDFDGDGKSDQLAIIGEHVVVLNDSVDIYTPFVYYGDNGYYAGLLSIQGPVHFPITTWVDMDKIYIQDFNGDGKAEIMLIKDSNCEIFAFENRNTIKEIYYAGFPTKWHWLEFGDFNGDGKIDILCRAGGSINSPWYIATYTGTEFLESPFYFNHPPDIAETYTKDKLAIADLNSDGLADIYHEWGYYDLSGSQIDVYYSKGTTFERKQSTNVGYLDVFTPVPIDINGDGRIEILYQDYYMDPIKIRYFGKDSKVNLLEKIRNGYNYYTNLSYKRLNEATNFYKRNAITAYPINAILAPLYTVYQLKNENGVGGFSTVTYSYNDALFHKAGKGFLGFKGITSIDPSGMIHSNSSTLDENYYFLKPDYSKTEVPINKITTLHSESNTVFSFANIYQAPPKVFYPYPSEVINKDYISGTKTKNETAIDAFGNPINSKISYFSSHLATVAMGYTQTSPSNYVNNGSWCLSKPMDVQSIQFRKDETNFTKNSHIVYDSKGNITQTVEYYGLPKSVTTTYSDFNKVGLPQTTTVSAAQLQSRESTVVFDDKFRYVLQTTNPEGLTSSATYDPAFGNKLTTTDANGLVTTAEYDGFGTPLQTTDPLGVWDKTELKWYTGGDKPNVIFYSESTSNNGPTERKYFDKLGRALFVSHENFSGQNVLTKTEYNPLGLVTSVSEPYFDYTTPTLFTTSTYDNLNRLHTITSPTGVVLTHTNPTAQNPGLLSTVNNSATSITTSQTLDAMGKVVKDHDPGGDIIYSYYSNGNPKTIVAPDNAMTTMLYDEYGHQTSLSDPDAGTTTYDYNAFGELIEQTDAKSNKFTMTYDKLGRLLMKTGTKAGMPNTVTTNTYNPFNAPNAKGLLNLTTYSNGTLSTSFSYLYDNYSRIIQKTEHADQDFNYFYTYDSKGNLQNYQFPSGFTISHTYENGYMKRVSNNGDGSSIFAPQDYTAKGQLRWWDNGAGDIIHNFNEYDQYGFPTNVLCGLSMGAWTIQNLETHFNIQTGNLEYRKDKNFMVNGSYLTENFTYDDVHKNRLASWQVSGQTSPFAATYADNNGNILSKSDVTSAGNDYIYASANNKPHAVSSITNPLLTPAETQQDITYNRFNKVEEIKHTNQGLRLNIFYGPDEQRIKSEFYTNNVLNKTKYFIGGDYEVEKLPNGSERHIHYLPGGGIYVSNELGTGQMYYVQSDYQGNWSSVADATGNVLERYSFDPWGRRRNHTDWSFNNVSSTFLFDRGYTGHEMLDAFGLINMNGRVYDPVMARFLSPDNYVQSLKNSQGFNRYSYCLNNPLIYSDPDGNNPLLFAVFLAGIINSAFQISSGNVHNMGDLALSFGIGALAGGAGAFVGGAVAGTIGIGGFTGGAIAGGAGGAAGGFIGGSGNAWMNGSDFGDVLMAGAEGIFSGVVAGGLLGGLGRGISDYSQGYNFWDGTGVDEYVIGTCSKDLIDQYKINARNYNSGSSADYNDPALQDRTTAEFGVKVGDMNLEPMTTKPGDGYGLTGSRGDFVNFKTHNIVSGYQIPTTGSKQAIHASPATLFADKIDFRAVVGHELDHAFHYYTIPNVNRSFSERVAYKYTYDVYMKNGQFAKALSTMQNAIYTSHSIFGMSRSFWGAFPSQYQIPSVFSFSH
jgi:RHS repeat-associated protein